jgi:glycosyltransferase involved in cell wall biosynthesis
MGATEAPTKLVEHARFRCLWKHPGTVRRLREEIRARRIDLVFAHFATAHLFGGAAARLEGVPCMWWQQSRYDQGPGLNQAAGHLRAGAVICSSDEVAAEQRRRFGRTPVVRINLGIEVSGDEPIRTHTETSAVRLGIVGRLQRWKRVELAVRAMPAVLQEIPDARLLVVGGAAPALDEDYPAELAAEARALGVDHAVEMVGEVEDGTAVIRNLDVLVHCAEAEPFGLVPLEAMVHGIPVVVPDEGGPRETVRQDVDGIRVDPTDTPALASAIVSLAADPARRAQMGANGREQVLSRFTARLMAERAWRVAAAVHSGEDPVAALGEGA